MDLPDTEGLAEDAVELLLGQLLAVALHAAGLHDHRVVQLRGIALGQIPQGVAYAQQDLGLRVRGHVAQQGLVVVEVEAARAAVADQAVGHVDQR